MAEPDLFAAIVDYGLGNLYSVKHACEHAGMRGCITSSADDLKASDVVLLPGVGAYQDAMVSLRKLGLVDTLREIAEMGKPLVGICLGMQLLMTRSYEFGTHDGLNLIQGEVVHFEHPTQTVDRGGQIEEQTLKVPQIGWNRVVEGERQWENTPLKGLPNDVFMYFVHSYYVKPTDQSVILATTNYGSIEFCSALQSNNIFACQFHPERSGPEGLRIYENLSTQIRQIA
jgi:glutamine amidotransferase